MNNYRGDRMSTCYYTAKEWIKNRYPRRMYESECGLQYCNLYEEVYIQKQGYERKPPQGICMKCKNEIQLTED